MYILCILVIQTEEIKKQKKQKKKTKEYIYKKRKSCNFGKKPLGDLQLLHVIHWIPALVSEMRGY